MSVLALPSLPSPQSSYHQKRPTLPYSTRHSTQVSFSKHGGFQVECAADGITADVSGPQKADKGDNNSK